MYLNQAMSKLLVPEHLYFFLARHNSDELSPAVLIAGKGKNLARVLQYSTVVLAVAQFEGSFPDPSHWLTLHINHMNVAQCLSTVTPAINKKFIAANWAQNCISLGGALWRVDFDPAAGIIFNIENLSRREDFVATLAPKDYHRAIHDRHWVISSRLIHLSAFAKFFGTDVVEPDFVGRAGLQLASCDEQLVVILILEKSRSIAEH